MPDYNSSYTGAQIDANLALAATAVQPADDAADLGSGAATDGYVLTADGAGGAAWEAASGGGGTPGGSTTQVQFNDGGAFGGDSGFTFDKTNNTLGLGGGTITASDPIIDMAQTWNNAAVTFTGIKSNITSTASADASLLMDLQVGGVSRFSVTKAGVSALPARSTYAFSTSGSYSVGLYSLADYTASIAMGSSPGAAPSPYKGFEFELTGPTLSMGLGTLDVKLTRDAANALAQRNGVNAQAFNLYQSYTDASNYTRGRVAAASGIVTIAGESAGTGATDIDIALTPKGTGRVRYGTHAAIAAETVTGYIEIKDAGGTVRKIAVVS
jgi:hypothetical protein